MNAAIIATLKDPLTRQRYEERLVGMIGSTPQGLDTVVEE